jgi:hypothetical protein
VNVHQASEQNNQLSSACILGEAERRELGIRDNAHIRGRRAEHVRLAPPSLEEGNVAERRARAQRARHGRLGAVMGTGTDRTMVHLKRAFEQEGHEARLFPRLEERRAHAEAHDREGAGEQRELREAELAAHPVRLALRQAQQAQRLGGGRGRGQEIAKEIAKHGHRAATACRRRKLGFSLVPV